METEVRERVRPVVLVGGKSRRFGRDKLREPFGGGMLVDRPIAALRGVFGACVALVGDCDPAVAARGDLHRADRYPGRGPMGGVLTALEEFGCAVFVLSGDLAGVTASGVRSVLGAALAQRDAAAVVGATPRVEPCFGVYRVASADALRRALEDGRLDLWRVIEGEEWLKAPLAASEAVNVNSVEEIERARGGPRDAS